MEKPQWEKDHGITADRFTQHHEYYLQLAATVGIGWPEGRDKFMGHDKEYWLNKYNEDKHLNNHPLRDFDSYAPWHIESVRGKGIPWSISNTVCCLKAVIKERIKK